MADQNQELHEVTQQVIDELNKFGRVSGATADALRDAEVGVKGFSNAVRTAPKAIGEAATSMAGAMYSGEKGAKAFNKSIDSMAQAADSAVTVLMAMIPGGPVVKAIVAGLGLLAKSLIKTAAEVDKAANIQGDALYDTYQKLGKAGVVAAGGTTQLGKDLNKLGLGFQEAESMVSLLTENSQDLALFGKTAFQGANAFTGIVNAAKPYREELQRLGLSQVEQNEAVMGYIKLQTRLGNAGRIQAQGYEATAAAAAKYIEEQDALTKLTGVSRKEQQKTLDDAMRNARFAATVDDLRAKGKEKEAEALQNSIALAARLGPETQKGLQDIASGFVNTKEARALMMSSQGEVVKMVADAKNGLLNNDKDLTKAYDKVEERIANTAGSLRGLTQAVGDTGTFIKYEEARKAEMLRKQGATTEESLAAAKKQTAGQVAGEDKRLKNQSETIVAQQDATLATQQMIDKAITPATEATLALAKAAKAAAQTLNVLAGNVVEKGAGTPGAATGGSGALGAEIMAQSESLNEEQTKILQKAQEAYREAVKNGTIMQKYYGVGLDQKMQEAKNTVKLAEQGKLNANLQPISGGAAAKGAAGAAGGLTGAAGLRLKSSEAIAGGESTESLYALAHKIQDSLGSDLKYFSGLNDTGRDKNSKHTSGKALDIVLNDPEKYASTLAMIKGMDGVTFAQYEEKGQRNANGSVATGTHIHAEVSAANGAILSGPRSGYQPNLTMHGTEAIVPLPDGKSIPVSTPGMGSSEMQQSFSNAVADMTGALMDALSEMIREQKNTNSINQKLLQAARN